MASLPPQGGPQHYRRDLEILRDDGSCGIANLPAPSIASSSSPAAYPTALHVPGSAGACSNCRRYHRKCNYARPCNNCISTDRSNTCADQLTAYETQRRTPSADGIEETFGIFGESATPWLSRPLRDPLPLPPLDTPLSGDLFIGQRLHLRDLRTAGSDGNIRRAQPSTQKAGIVSAQPLPLPALPPSSTTRSVGAASKTGTSTSTGTAENQPVTCILGTNMKLGRVSVSQLLPALAPRDNCERADGTHLTCSALCRRKACALSVITLMRWSTKRFPPTFRLRVSEAKWLPALCKRLT